MYEYSSRYHTVNIDYIGKITDSGTWGYLLTPLSLNFTISQIRIMGKTITIMQTINAQKNVANYLSWSNALQMLYQGSWHYQTWTHNKFILHENMNNELKETKNRTRKKHFQVFIIMFGERTETKVTVEKIL